MRTSFKVMQAACACAIAIAGLAAVPACSDDSADKGSVEIIHWWNQGGEEQAISALLAEFRRQYPSIGIVDGSVEGGSFEARATIADRMNKADPPDTFQANGGWSLMEWVLYNEDDADKSKMAPIDDVAADWMDLVPPKVLDSVSYTDPDPIKGTHIYAVPLNIHRLNTLFYNKAIFEDLAINPQEWTQLSDLFDAAAAIRNQKQIAPFALGYGEKQSWTLALLFFENLMVGHQQGALYQQMFDHPMDFDPFSPEITYLMEDFRTVLSYANEDADELPWDKAMNRVLKGQAAMTIMGDWAKGYADADPDPAHRDAVGFIAMPGTAGTFVFTTDTFGLPIQSNPRPDQVDDTKKLLQVFGSQEGQRIFNEKKGSISARRDVVIPENDSRRPTFEAFRDATTIVGATSILAQQSYVDAISAALANFARNWQDATASEVQHTLNNYRDQLLSSCWPVCLE
jgi:glucose/mannose transport system substrate-binding protein